MTDAPLREIRPIPVPAQYLLTAPFAAAFASFFPAFFSLALAGVATALLGGTVTGMSDGPPFGLAFAVYCMSFVVFMALLWAKHFLEPAKTCYRIFADRVEYAEGLWSRQYRTVIYDQVIDVELTEGVLQQTQRVGTVTLVTQQLISNQQGRLSNRRFALVNIPDARGIYELIRSLAIKRSSGGTTA